MSRQSSSGLMVTVVSIVGGVYLAVLVCGFLVNYSTAHPQLQFDDQSKASGNVYPEIIRIRRQGGGGGGGWGSNPYIGPVYTYAKTDHHANFKWGVRHHVGGQGWYGGR